VSLALEIQSDHIGLPPANADDPELLPGQAAVESSIEEILSWFGSASASSSRTPVRHLHALMRLLDVIFFSVCCALFVRFCSL
jgi:hypothetical protein